MAAYYNDNDPYIAQWLRNLAAKGSLPAGTVDARSILKINPDDFAGYDQCHFFAGIAGWAYALALAGWPDDREVWTASCPCQPLSSAGRRAGHADERHLWPAFYRLVALCRPATIFGEQVSSKDGREWFAGIRADLEHLGYAVGAADLPAASVGAPHIRQRLFWVADAAEIGRSGWPEAIRRKARCDAPGSHRRLVDTGKPRLLPSQPEDLHRERRRQEGRATSQSGGSLWSGAAWFPCFDGKTRRVEPSIFPLADGIPGRVGRLRAYGNAIVPQVAALFIRSFMDYI